MLFLRFSTKERLKILLVSFLALGFILLLTYFFLFYSGAYKAYITSALSRSRHRILWRSDS